MELIAQLREAAPKAPPELQDILSKAAEELDMLEAAFHDGDVVTTQALKEAIRNERAACALIADAVRNPTGDAIASEIRSRPTP